jgi:two-component system catabolic regulation response regulator CreB/two-component system response regulator ChvI
LKDNNASNGDNGTSTFSSSNSNNRQLTYKILIVDDEPDILYAFQKGLERNGFEVDAFTDPEEALSHFKNKNRITNNSTTNITTTNTFTNSNYYYDLLLLDFKMPKMNGFELYTEMKKVVQDNKITKVCFITAFEEYYNTLKKDFPALDVRCFIKKPIEVQDLVREIKAELDK